MTDSTSDHDLILELRVRMEDLKKSIEDLTNSVTKKVDSHELRLSNLEVTRENFRSQLDGIKSDNKMLKTWFRGMVIGFIMVCGGIIAGFCSVVKL